MLARSSSTIAVQREKLASNVPDKCVPKRLIRALQAAHRGGCDCSSSTNEMDGSTASSRRSCRPSQSSGGPHHSPQRTHKSPGHHHRRRRRRSGRRHRSSLRARPRSLLSRLENPATPLQMGNTLIRYVVNASAMHLLRTSPPRQTEKLAGHPPRVRRRLPTSRIRPPTVPLSVERRRSRVRSRLQHRPRRLLGRLRTSRTRSHRFWQPVRVQVEQVHPKCCLERVWTVGACAIGMFILPWTPHFHVKRGSMPKTRQ